MCYGLYCNITGRGLGLLLAVNISMKTITIAAMVVVAAYSVGSVIAHLLTVAFVQ